MFSVDKNSENERHDICRRNQSNPEENNGGPIRMHACNHACRDACSLQIVDECQDLRYRRKLLNLFPFSKPILFAFGVPFSFSSREKCSQPQSISDYGSGKSKKSAKHVAIRIKGRCLSHLYLSRNFYLKSRQGQFCSLHVSAVNLHTCQYIF